MFVDTRKLDINSNIHTFSLLKGSYQSSHWSQSLLWPYVLASTNVHQSLLYLMPKNEYNTVIILDFGKGSYKTKY